LYCKDACKQADYRKRKFRNAQAVTIAVQRAARKQVLDERRRLVEQAMASADVDEWRVDQADCLEWFAARPVDSIHLVFGSGPYEDARKYGIDFKLTGEKWVAWMADVYEAALRCCTGLVAFVLEGKTDDFRWSAVPALLMADLHRRGVHLRHPAIYYRDGIPGSGGTDWLKNNFEFIVCAARPGQLPWSDPAAMGQPPKYRPGGDPTRRTKDGTRVGQGTSGHANGDLKTLKRYVPPDIANPGNVIRCNVGGGRMGDQLAHENEAPFSEYLAEFFIRSFCPPGGVVCDPFVGSGTTAKVAVQHGRRFVGCDIREEAVLLSKQRLLEAKQQLPV
jgi:site-specific DNA-methyltransferase (adenine-specific)